MAEHPIVFDRMLLRARRRRAQALEPATFLLDRVAVDLTERLDAVLREFPLAVDLGTPADTLRRALVGKKNIGTLIAAGMPPRKDLAVIADEEALPFRDASLDLVVSALALQFVNDLPGALIQIR